MEGLLRLIGIEGIPNAVERIDRFAFAIEYSRKPHSRGEDLPSSFLPTHESAPGSPFKGVSTWISGIRGISSFLKRETFIIDFNSSFSFGEKGFFRRFLFPVLRWVDYGGLLKLKERVSPSLMTPEESSFLKRFNLLRRLWIFN
jgi:hypothetical protein